MKPRQLAGIVAMASLAGACGPSESDFIEHSVHRSPDGAYYLVIDSARSRLAFGAQTIRLSVVAKDRRSKKHLLTTRISNDGVALDESNLKLAWAGPHSARLCLSGSEQRDSAFEIDLRELSQRESGGDCD